MALNFSTDLTIDSCEEFIAKLADAPQEAPLYLPVEVSNSHFGGVAAAIQAINTWGRSREYREIIVGGNPADADDLVREAVSKPHKFCASMLSKRITDSNASTDLRPIVNRAASEIIEGQGKSKFGQQRGPLCWFAFVDHSTKGFDKNFYTHPQNEKPQPRQLAQIETVIRSMVNKSIDIMGATKQLAEEDMSHLGRIFFELFMNSHEHGTKDKTRSDWLKPGQRVIYSNGINLPKAAIDKRAQTEKGLSLYLQSQNNQNNRRRFIEISIIDSGLGYYKRWCADQSDQSDQETNDNINHEYSILKRCFTSRQTSSANVNKGHGLPVVMDRLTKLNGFMRVRSGRLSLYRDFVTQPYVPDDPCEFFDWTTEQPAQAELTPMLPVVGVSVTFLIPLEEKQ
ncbi:hypothetical protein [Pseudomonas weihenstephanensis]|uniref:ATP-binding protein n=1 Tax=Pseudomonas weihenstephanensis TaxID=1608994 RepID=A0ABS1ZLC2_9PSED|nr:hypothetical protein [Pseudomonas weihenstephanensis]MBM1197250.1 hypothetical protein [Pseudomonas weihenstephanensis]